MNYTFGKSESTQGGDLSAYYIAGFENNQDFWDPEFDRGPSSNDIRHRLNASFIYELPALAAARASRTACSAAGRFPASSRRDRGTRCASRSRPGSIAAGPTSSTGVDLIVADWTGHLHGDRLQLSEHGRLRRACRRARPRMRRFGPAPTIMDMARGPSSLNAHTTFAKSFGIGAGSRLQVRADIFNALNRKNYNNPQQAINNANFGRITGAGGSRSVPVGRPADVLEASLDSRVARALRGRPRFRSIESPEIAQIQAFATKRDNP